MDDGAQPSVDDLRRTFRYAVDHHVVGEHRRLGDLPLHITNISDQGFMATGAHGLRRGDRIVVRLPVIGRIEAHVIWSIDERSGFKFERVIRHDDFAEVVDAMQAGSAGAERE